MCVCVAVAKGVCVCVRDRKKERMSKRLATSEYVFLFSIFLHSLAFFSVHFLTSIVVFLSLSLCMSLCEAKKSFNRKKYNVYITTTAKRECLPLCVCFHVAFFLSLS